MGVKISSTLDRQSKIPDEFKDLAKDFAEKSVDESRSPHYK